MPTPAAQLSPRRLVIRAWGVLLLLLGLSAVTLAAASSGRPDPASAVLTAARAHLGDTYTWGATGPKTWDCSGFTSVLWHDVGGVDVPRTSRQQQAWAVPLPIEQALPGDLVFFGDPVTHVGLVQSRVTRGTGAGATHTLTMVDASSSQKGVVERRVWSSGTVRFGRVPRKGMPPVTPWTAPTPAASPMPSTSPSTPSPAPSPAPSASPSSAPSPAPSPAPALAALAAQGATRVSPALPGLPAVQSVPSSAVAQKAVRLASAALGNQTLTDAGLVANVWRRAGGAALPTARAALVAKAHRVPLADARLGDLVVYAAPASHVGLYLGEGTMIDASRALHAVVSRPVWSAPGVQIMRLPG